MTYDDVQWSPMPLFASSLVTHKCSSPLAAHFQESCHFLFVFSFSSSGFAFPFSLRCFFAGGCYQTAAATCCEMNSLEHGWKFPIAKARLLTLTQTWKQTKDESSGRYVFTCVRFWSVKSGLHSCTLAKYEHASRAWESVNPNARRHFNTPLACGRVVIYIPVYLKQLSDHSHSESNIPKAEWRRMSGEKKSGFF